MILEIILYEVSTTIAGLLGIKAISFAGVNKQMMGIKQPKRIPIVDRILKSKIGKTSKREEWMSRKAVSVLSKISKYRSFRYLLILAGRSIKNESMAKGRAISPAARRDIHIRELSAV